MLSSIFYAIELKSPLFERTVNPVNTNQALDNNCASFSKETRTPSIIPQQHHPGCRDPFL